MAQVVAVDRSDQQLPRLWAAQGPGGEPGPDPSRGQFLLGTARTSQLSGELTGRLPPAGQDPNDDAACLHRARLTDAAAAHIGLILSFRVPNP